MKAKLLLIAAFGGLLATLGSCSDDAKNIDSDKEFEIRQVRLDVTNEMNASTARSSENPASAAASVQYAIVYADGSAAVNAAGKALATKINITKPTNAVIAAEGDVLTLSFTPGEVVLTDVTVTLPGGELATLDEDGNIASWAAVNGPVTLSSENADLVWKAPAFNDGDMIKAEKVIAQNGNTYQYTGVVYLWHYHAIVLNADDTATASKAFTEDFNYTLNAVVEVPVTEGGQVVFDEEGSPVFAETNVLLANNGDAITLKYVPSFPGDSVELTFPDGTSATLTAEAPSMTWTAPVFTDGAEISAVLNIAEGANALTFTRSIIINHPAE